MMLHKKMRELSVGAVVEITCTDPSTQRDIPKFCHYLKHSLLAAHQDDELYHLPDTQRPLDSLLPKKALFRLASVCNQMLMPIGHNSSVPKPGW